MNDDIYELAAEKYRDALAPGELEEFALDGADRLGVPCHSALWTPERGGFKAGVGYGPTRAVAQCGALGELSEDLHAHQALESWPRVAGSFAQMREKYGARAVVDPVSLVLEAGTLYTPETELDWIEIERFGADEKVWVPAEFVACSWSDLPAQGNPELGESRRGRLVTPVTNGLGAGLDREQAVLHGLLELLQRDGNGLSIRALATSTALDLVSVTDPQCLELLEKFEAAGIDLAVKIASLDFGMTGFYVSGLDREEAANGASGVMALAGGEAVHPVAVVGLRKALLEWAASRSRVAFFHGPLQIAREIAPPGYVERIAASFHPEDEEPRTLESMKAWSKMSLREVRELMMERIHRVEKRLRFEDLPTYVGEDVSKSALLELVCARLRANGLEILVADYSTAGNGVCAVKALVPGLEVETLSYSRIGVRNLARLMDLTRRGGPVLAGISGAPEGALPLVLPDAVREQLRGAWFDARAAEEVVGPLFSIYREPGRHAVGLLDG